VWEEGSREAPPYPDYNANGEEMKETNVASFNDFHASMLRYLKNRRWLFRGHNRLEWLLVPKFGREEYKNANFDMVFASWKRRATELISISPLDDWDWMAITQHHGLATKLLDWSFNPLVAAFFAVYPEENEDCVIYAYDVTRTIETQQISPKDYHGVSVFKPRGIASRISRQGSIFTYHNPPDYSLEEYLGDSEIEKLIINKDYRRQFIFELDKYGINKMNLFPDLDGLSDYCNWSSKVQNIQFWDNDEVLE